jgi:sugar lactone lactonase YvrE
MTDVFSDIPCALGESALWDGSRFYWVDVLGGTVYAQSWGGSLSTVDVGSPVGSVGLRAGGGLVAARRHDIAFVDVDRGTCSPVVPVEAGVAGNRLNDGAVDAAGRFWFGSMDLAERSPAGSFYRLDADLTVTPAFGGIVCSNGPAWSPDGRTMYHVDSTRRMIRSYDVDPVTGDLGPGKPFVSDEDCEWFPDGVTIDAEGFVWNCKWDGGRLVRYAPDGSVDRVVRVPVPRPTRCAFVGPDLSTLAVTSARVGLDAATLAEFPLSGRVLLLDPDARGAPTPAFAG